MPLVSDEIKRVPRPPHTEVRYLGKKYYVVPYVSVRVKGKKNPVKKSYPYCGFIVYDEVLKEYKYVERNLRVLVDEPGIKRYGDVAFIDELCKDFCMELTNYFGEADGTKIYVYSMMRLLYGDTNKNISEEYKDSYISELYRNIPISKNTVYDFIARLGMHYNKVQDFFIMRKKEHKVLIFDGTPITYEAENGYSEYGRNAKKSIKKQIMEVKVYDVETKEPVYFETIPGNVIDKTAFLQILQRFDPKNSVIIVDKGFNSKENIDYLFSLENNYNFIVPFNDNSKDIKKILLGKKYNKMFISNGKKIYGLKEEIDNRKYYIFKDPYIATREETDYMEKIILGRSGYTQEKLDERQKTFGTIAFVSNLDIDEKTIYDYYSLRWEIEVNVKLEKNTMDSNVVRMHSEKGLLGVRALSQVSMTMLSRVYFKLKELKLLETLSIRETLNELGKTYMHFKNGKWILGVLPKKKLKLLAKLSIV